jgi:hypothetical protein
VLLAVAGGICSASVVARWVALELLCRGVGGGLSTSVASPVNAC